MAKHFSRFGSIPMLTPLYAIFIFASCNKKIIFACDDHIREWYMLIVLDNNDNFVCKDFRNTIYGIYSHFVSRFSSESAVIWIKNVNLLCSWFFFILVFICPVVLFIDIKSQLIIRWLECNIEGNGHGTWTSSIEDSTSREVQAFYSASEKGLVLLLNTVSLFLMLRALMTFANAYSESFHDRHCSYVFCSLFFFWNLGSSCLYFAWICTYLSINIYCFSFQFKLHIRRLLVFCILSIMCISAVPDNYFYWSEKIALF